MIKNYLTIAVRNLLKNRSFSFINIFGLAVGLACCLFIGAYIYQELSYDTFLVNANRIFRVGIHLIENGKVNDFPMVDNGVGGGIKKNFPEVEAFTRLEKQKPVYVISGDQQIKEDKLAIADANFLNFFSLALISGNQHDALADPYSIVVTKDFAEKYFGQGSVLGKTLQIKGSEPFKITGVINKVPQNSHFHYDAFISRSSYKETHETWSNVGDFTYLMLHSGADPKLLETRLPQLVSRYVVPEIQHDMGVSLTEAQKSVNTFRFFLQPLKDIHLSSHTRYELEPPGDIQYIYIFGALALFIIMLACINFTNLSIASSIKRSKEVGVRKVMGSLRKSLVLQFLTESVLLTSVAMAMALVFAWFLLPYFNQVSGKQFTVGDFTSINVLAVLAATVFAVGCIAGLYPAFFISSFKILDVLKGKMSGSSRGKNMVRSSLIVFQFAVSTSMIIATIIVYQQLHFMQNKKLGYDKEQVLIINEAWNLGHSIDAFRNELAADPNVLNATICSNTPGGVNMDGTQIYAKDLADMGERNEIHTNIYHIDQNFIPTLGMTMARGRNFSLSFPGDSSSVIINEAAIHDLGWNKTDPLGKTIVRSGNRSFTVVGVVKDFNYTSAKQKVAPLIMLLGHGTGAVVVKLRTNNISSAIERIKAKWNDYHTGNAFNYAFLDDQFTQLYSTEIRTGRLFAAFTVVGIIIAALGLFGLAAFIIRQRVKEIGIRKVLGASSGSISHMLSAEFLKLVCVAIIISFPLTWLAMNKWLQDFAYRINIQWWVFLAAGGAALGIAYLTVSFQSVKAALENPVKSLRSE